MVTLSASTPVSLSAQASSLSLWCRDAPLSGAFTVLDCGVSERVKRDPEEQS